MTDACSFKINVWIAPVYFFVIALIAPTSVSAASVATGGYDLSAATFEDVIMRYGRNDENPHERSRRVSLFYKQ